MTRHLRTLVAASLLLAACGEDAEAPGTSTFNGDLSGAYTAPLNGEAKFGVTLDDGSNAVGLALILGERGAARIFLASTATPRPLEGTYAIVAPGASTGKDTVFAGSLGYVVNGALQQYEIRSGTITLTRVGYTAVVGNFELQAVRIGPCCDPDPVEIVVTGTFDAAQINQVF